MMDVFVTNVFEPTFEQLLHDTKMGTGPWNLVPEILWEPFGACVECNEELESAYGLDE